MQSEVEYRLQAHFVHLKGYPEVGGATYNRLSLLLLLLLLLLALNRVALARQ